MRKIVHAHTVLLEDVLVQLKKKTGEHTTKEALAKAVYHYIVCQHAQEEKRKKVKSEPQP